LTATSKTYGEQKHTHFLRLHNSSEDREEEELQAKQQQQELAAHKLGNIYTQFFFRRASRKNKSASDVRLNYN
jgi:hypothetical protein